jgi:alkaline phosphatase D
LKNAQLQALGSTRFEATRLALKRHWGDHVLLGVALAGIVVCCPPTGAAAQFPHQATGIKIGEVDSNSAIIWMRLTANAERVGADGGMPEVQYFNRDTGEYEPMEGRPNATPRVTFSKGRTVETLEGAVPGSPGKIRVLYKTLEEFEWQKTEWYDVNADQDYTRQTLLDGLQPNTTYQIRTESESGSVVEGQFQTAPEATQEARVLFTVSTGQAYQDMDTPEGFRIYPAMVKLRPQFFVHTGDILYYDKLAKNLDLARWHWQRTYSLPTNIEFHRHVASYFIKDDHDTWMNDCWPSQDTQYMGEFTFEQGQRLFLEQVPMGGKTYRTVRWGRDLQVWFVEGRDFRSPNNMPDGPRKTIWGEEQMNWFMNTTQASDATFRILITPTPILGPDRPRKADNHANKAFRHEGNRLRSFIATQNNMLIICGDRHWQYVSVDPEAGIREYSCGPASDSHAGGFRQEDRSDFHRYLKIKGGFLSVAVERVRHQVQAVLTHHGVDGTVYNRDIVEAGPRGGIHTSLEDPAITPANTLRPFFPIDNGLIDVPSLEDQAVLLSDLGYSGICTRPKSSTPELLAVFDRHGLGVLATYVTLTGKEAEVPGHVVEHLSQLNGQGTIVWLMLKDEDASDDQAVAIIRKVADLAAANDLPVVLYPHVGCRTSTVKECDRLRELAERPGLGVSFNLCHFLRQNEDEILEETIRSVASNLKLVQINGANDVPMSTPDWDELIKPLGEGNFDVGRVLRTLDEIGYTGPVNLQCYQVPPPAREHLETSMNAWKRYHESHSARP